ncbi:Uncharacterized protein dnm_020830 [Desulfonema magnum]|uniref:Uncharacterized protein n=1 Tax=Desulfonema magnum TaxID=45655 RepID=A0A975BJ73_9BACT|nr:Uncharacterized protein dnm_020830 [Desulfonema magnum]
MKIHFENPGFLSENIFMTGMTVGEKPGFFMSVYFYPERAISFHSIIKFFCHSCFRRNDRLFV